MEFIYLLQLESLASRPHCIVLFITWKFHFYKSLSYAFYTFIAITFALYLIAGRNFASYTGNVLFSGWLKRPARFKTVFWQKLFVEIFRWRYRNKLREIFASSAFPNQKSKNDAIRYSECRHLPALRHIINLSAKFSRRNCTTFASTSEFKTSVLLNIHWFKCYVSLQSPPMMLRSVTRWLRNIPSKVNIHLRIDSWKWNVQERSFRSIQSWEHRAQIKIEYRLQFGC